MARLDGDWRAAGRALFERRRQERIAHLIDEADQAMQAGRFGLALDKLDQVERIQPTPQPELELLRATCAVRSGNEWKARQILAAATARWPDDERITALRRWLEAHR
ncbi:MAG: hypothetical protein D6725_14690 [Planctomycetota bacterium]|nr:MAG: hypothetical protein D6725_14690 [Planctomycetota bacterium]